ncbi:hypothetical protein OXX80_002779 [Metschnikowia pulcherrima]
MSTDPYEGVLPRAMATIRAASALAAKDIKFHSSIDHKLAQDFENSGKKLLDIANRLLQGSGPGSSAENVLEFGEAAATSEGSWKKVSDALDVFFEKADLAMDASKAPKPTSEYLHLNDASDAGLAATVNEKPQLKFKVPVDNSEKHPFVPKLTTKPHATKPLDQCMVLVDDGNGPAHYEQPYLEEIMNSAYPPLMEKVIEQPPTDWTQTAATWVDSVAELHKMVSELSKCTEIAVDLEHHDLHSYYGITCLMQISSRDADWIVDTLALRDDLSVLNEVFADPKIVKVFHGANMDIIWLQRDLGLYVVSLFDTYFASKALGFPKFSLAYLLETFAKFKTSKKYQLADWRIRPLPDVMMEYARADTHFLLNIYDQLRNRLIDADPAKLTEVLENSRKVAAKRFEYVSFRPPTAYNSGMFSNDAISADNFIASYNIPQAKHDLVRELFLWRDRLARNLDESPRFIMPSRVLVNICCLTAPITSQSLINCFTNFSKILRENLDSLTALVQTAYSNMDEPEASTYHVPKQTEFEITPESVREMTELYSIIVEKAELHGEDALLADESRVFSATLQNAGFSVQIPENGSKPKLVGVDEIKERLEAVKSITFTPLKHSKIEFVDPEEKTSAKKHEARPAEIEEPTNEEPATEEIITLVPKKNRKYHSKPKPVQEEMFDYTALESKVLDKTDTKIKKKKRSYEPFGKQDVDAPQPFKGRKLAPQGKTTSFTKKRK